MVSWQLAADSRQKRLRAAGHYTGGESTDRHLKNSKERADAAGEAEQDIGKTERTEQTHGRNGICG